MPVRLRPSAIDIDRANIMMDYLPIAVFSILACVIGVLPVALARFVSDHQPTKAKRAPFECGFPSEGDMRVPFDIRYYLVAILFILFDLETAFLFPWAVSIQKTQWWGFGIMMFFLVILTVGFVFEWKKDALEWK